MRLAAALTVMTLVAQRLVIASIAPELTTKAHWHDVIHDLRDAPTLHTYRMLREVRVSILAPLSGVVSRLLMSALVHRLALLRLWHTWHHGSSMMMSDIPAPRKPMKAHM